MDESRLNRPTYVTRFFAGMVELYQGFSAFGLRRCRFTPTCSEYLKQAVLEQGVLKGASLGSRRILKCHPWHPGGYDPVSSYGK